MAPCLQDFSQTHLSAVLAIGLVQVRLKTFADAFIHLECITATSVFYAVLMSITGFLANVNVLRYVS